MVVDRQMQVLPSRPAGVALAGSIASDPVTDPSEFAELLDVDVDEFTRMGALIASHRLGGLESRKPVEAKAAQGCG